MHVYILIHVLMCMPVSIKFSVALVNQNTTISGDNNMPCYCAYSCSCFVLTVCSFKRHSGYKWYYLALVVSHSTHFTVAFHSCEETSWHYGFLHFYFYSDSYSVMGIQKKLTSLSLSPLLAKNSRFYRKLPPTQTNCYII